MAIQKANISSYSPIWDINASNQYILLTERTNYVLVCLHKVAQIKMYQNIKVIYK